MIRSPVNQPEHHHVHFRRQLEQTISAVDTLKASYLPPVNSIDPLSTNYCAICGQHFARQSLLAEHLQLIHNSAGVLLASNVGASKIDYQCTTCDVRFASNIELDEHTRITHQSFLMRCTSCGLYGVTSTSETLIDGQEYKCLHCGTPNSAMMIAEQQSYLDHQMQQFMASGVGATGVAIETEPEIIEKSLDDIEADEPRIPPIRVKLNRKKKSKRSSGGGGGAADDDDVTSAAVKIRRTSSRALRKAENNAESVETTNIVADKSPGRIRHSCPTCPKTFKSLGTLAKHQKTHDEGHDAESTPKLRPFSCNHCGKTFTQSNTLKQHIRIHTGEKPFGCNYCEKSFGVKDYLTKHIRTHTGEKPYQCSCCDKRFTQRSALTIHATKLHPLQP